MSETALIVAQKIEYICARTIELIVGEDKSFYFIELNSRLQAEHTFTEIQPGINLVEWQILIASGQTLPLKQKQNQPKGHSIEVRVCAEILKRVFSLVPANCSVAYDLGSQITKVRVDQDFQASDKVSSYYDSMLVKVIVHEKNRELALRQLMKPLSQSLVISTESNLDFLQKLIGHLDLFKGYTNTMFVDIRLPELLRNGFI